MLSPSASLDEELDEGLCPPPSVLSETSTVPWLAGLEDADEAMVLELLGL